MPAPTIAMIQDLSLTLRNILTQPGLPADLAAAQIVFDRPGDTFAPAQTTIDLFLYDLRENVDLRSSVPDLSRTNGQVTIVQPPLRLACSYLVTAWPVGGAELPLQEHQLLSEVLQVMSRYPTIPAAFLVGSLVGQTPPLPMVALHPDALKNVAEFWTSLGSRLRASLSLTVTISMAIFAPETAPIVISAETGMQLVNAPGTHVATFVIAGTLTTSAGAPAAGATVTVVESGLSATTDAGGKYSIGALAAGSYTLQAVLGASMVTKGITVPAAAASNYNMQFS